MNHKTPGPKRSRPPGTSFRVDQRYRKRFPTRVLWAELLRISRVVLGPPNVAHAFFACFSTFKCGTRFSQMWHKKSDPYFFHSRPPESSESSDSDPSTCTRTLTMQGGGSRASKRRIGKQRGSKRQKSDYFVSSRNERTFCLIMIEI